MLDEDEVDLRKCAAIDHYFFFLLGFTFIMTQVDQSRPYAIHMQIRAGRTSGSSTYIMARFRLYVAQANVMFAGCKLSRTTKN